MISHKALLFTGLLFLGLAGIAFLAGLHPLIFWVLLCTGICLKVSFVVATLIRPGFKMSTGMYLILTGVGLILLSLIFKHVVPVLWLRNILFYGAILLKASGLILLLYRKKI